MSTINHMVNSVAGHAESGTAKNNRVAIEMARQAERNTAEAQIEQQEKAKLARYTCDDIGNGYRFADQHRDKALHANGLGWTTFETTRWIRNEKGAMLLAKSTAQRIWDETNKASLDGTDAGADRAKRLATWAHRSRSSGALSAMLKLAESELGADSSSFDAHPHLLNCKNGTLDLNTLTLQPHDPNDRLTKTCAANYRPGAPCPLWCATVERFLPDGDVRSFMQRSLGAALFGRGLKQFWFLYGPNGDNGKTTILRAAALTLGDYAESVEIESLCDGKRSAGDESDIAKLMGARLVQVEETNGHRLNEGLVKRMTGEGDKLHAKFMGQNKFSFDVTFKLFMFGNSRPRMSPTDKALWKRVLCVPFNVVIPKSEQIDNFAEKLAAEVDGILAWLIEGYIAWRQDGLNPPDAVVKATEEHRDENDELGQFINENMLVGPTYRVKVADFKTAFYASGATMRPRELSKQMRERFGEPQSGAGNCYFYSGIGLLSNNEGR